MKYKIIEKIGLGTSATVYKIQIGKKYYALRRQKLFKNEYEDLNEIFKSNNLIESTDNGLIRGIYFNSFINTINTNHFTILYKYYVNKCNFTQELTDSCKNNPTNFKRYTDLLESKYCVEMIYDLKDGIMFKLIPQLSNKQIYSMIIQCIYALHLMHSNGYYHRDVNDYNWCYTKTKLKYINILGLKIPTFGYLYSIIDYSDCYNLKFKLSSDETKEIFARYNNLKYEDNMNFLMYNFFPGSYFSFTRNLVLRIIQNDKTVQNEIYYSQIKSLNYEQLKYFCKYANDSIKIIKYFYKLI